MKSLSRVASGIVCVGLTSAAMAASFNGTYTQDFNSMGTGTSVPSGWAVYSFSGGHDTYAPADSSTPGVTPTGLPASGQSATLRSTLVAATPGTQKSSSGYNWAVGGSTTERSLGTSPTGISAEVLQLTLTNDTGTPVTALDISYDIRRFSVAGNGNGYSSSPYYGKEEYPGYWLFYSLDGGTTYTNISSLNPDGHTWPNTVGTSSLAADNVALSSPWSAGGTLLLRWLDDNAQSPSPDQLIGLDNLAITAVTAPTPEPASLALLALGAGVLTLRRRRVA